VGFIFTTHWRVVKVNHTVSLQFACGKYVYTFQVYNVKSFNKQVGLLLGPDRIKAANQNSRQFLLSVTKRVFEQLTLLRLTQRPDDEGTSETSVNFYQTTKRNNTEDSHLQSLS
jgi:hypothetical protein